MGNWIDVPVRDIIAYFMNTLGRFTTVAVNLARITALLGIVWSAIQMALGTLQVRKFVTDYFIKFVFFLLIISLYPAFTKGLKTFAIQLGMKGSGASVSTLTQALSDYLRDLEKLEHNLDAVIDTQETLVNKYKQDLKSAAYANKSDLEIQSIATDLLNAERELEKVKKKKGKNRDKKINAIRSVLVTDSGKNRANSYKMDLDMKTSTGKSLGYLSPDAVARITLLTGQIIWENEWAFDVVANVEHKNIADMTPEEREEFRTSSVDGSKKIPFHKFPIGAIWNITLVFICVIALYLTTIACLIQYIMAIIEYFISTSYCIVLVPLMLFEGLNDLANKVLPMLLAQAVKLSMITMAMMYNVYQYLKIAMTMTTTATAFQWSDFFYVVFTSLLIFSLTVNAPKWAVTILTGQPQMSMGEFVQTAGAVMMGTRMTSQAVNSGMAMAKAGMQGALRQGANRFGDAAAMIGSATRAFDDGRGAFGAMSAAGSTLMSRTGKRIGANFNSFVHGTGARGGGAGGTAPGGVSNRLNAGDAHEAERMNSKNPKFVQGALDANGNRVLRAFADTAAMNYADAKYNDGEHQYTGSMSFRDYLRTQYNSAYGIKEERDPRLSDPDYVPPARTTRKPGTVSNVRFTGDPAILEKARARAKADEERRKKSDTPT